MKHFSGCPVLYRLSPSITMGRRLLFGRLRQQKSSHTTSVFLSSALPSSRVDSVNSQGLSSSFAGACRTDGRSSLTENPVSSLSGVIPTVFPGLSPGCRYTPPHDGGASTTDTSRGGANSEVYNRMRMLSTRISLAHPTCQTLRRHTPCAFSPTPLYNVRRNEGSERSPAVSLGMSIDSRPRSSDFARMFLNRISTCRLSVRVEEVSEALQLPFLRPRPPPSAASHTAAESSACGLSTQKLYRVLIGERVLQSPKCREILLPSRDLLLLLAAEHVGLQTALRQCLTADEGEGSELAEDQAHFGSLGQRGREEGQKEKESSRVSHAVEERASERSRSPFPSVRSPLPLHAKLKPLGGGAVDPSSRDRRRDVAMAAKAKRLRNFLKQRPLTWRQPVSSIVFTAVDVIADDPQSTASTLVNLIHGDTALSRERLFEEEEGRQHPSWPQSAATSIYSGLDCGPSSASLSSSSSSASFCASSEFSPHLPKKAEEKSDSAAAFLRDTLCAAPWKEQVRTREQNVLEKHVRAFEARHRGVTLHRSHGISLVPQTPQVLQVSSGL